jgi:plasmid rolling circle replication initiator protein Rep
MKKQLLQQKSQKPKKEKLAKWTAKKKESVVLSYSLNRLGDKKKANRVWWCASVLEFEQDINSNLERVINAHFCRERLCPMCQWRKSLKIFHQVSQVMDKIEQDYKNLVPLFLTLTVENCIGNDLASTIDTLLNGWRYLSQKGKKNKFNRVVRGWFRALEVTYNKQEDTFHPHIHAIILVDKRYFKRTNKDYIKHYQWSMLWRDACNLSYLPSCKIQTFDHKGHKGVAEVAKYTFKGNQMLYTNDDILTDKLIGTLALALKNRRLYALGGVMKDTAKQINIKLGDGCLMNLEDQSIRRDIFVGIIKRYNWDYTRNKYMKQ